jgi:uncharacterized protein involved in outer membrane biogenesis
MASDTVAQRSFLYRRRRWLILLGILLAVRGALPEILRRVLVSQVSQRLQTRVEIGDVDLALHRGGVALKNVALYSPAPLAPDEPPLVAWQRFAVEMRYLPLLWKTVQLRRVVLEGPHVALDRLSNGEINLRRLVPPSEPAPPQPPPEQAQGGGWKTGIDSFVLRAGAVRFRDLSLPGGEPLEIAIPDVNVGEIALQPGLYGEPGRVRLYIKTEGGAVRIDSQLWVLDQGFALGTRVKAHHLPLRRARFYIPGVGWSELRGQLDAVVDHGIAPGAQNALSAFVRLRDVAIQVPDVPQAAFALDRLAVRVAPLDLAARRVRVRKVDIAGASVVVDLQGGGDVLPLLHRGRAAEAPTETAAPSPAEKAPAESSPWHWAVDSIRLADSKVSLQQEGAPLDIGITAGIRGLADEGDPGRLELNLSVPPGSVAVAGALRPTPPGFGGSVRIEQLPLHDLVRAARAQAKLPPGLLKTTTLGVNLALEAGLTAEGAASAPAGALRAKGDIGAEGVRIEGPDPAAFAVSWKRLTVPIDTIDLPGLLPGAPSPAEVPMRVTLGAVALEEPAVQVTRTAEGIVLPPLGAAADAKGEAPAPAAAPAPAPGGDAGARPAPDVAIASFRLSGGRVGIVDQTVKPFFSGEIKPLEVDARGIRSVGPVVDRFTVSATTPQKGKIDITGSLRPEGGTVRVNGESVALTPYNPYVSAFAPYSLGRGSALSVRTDVTFGKGRYDTKTALTLHRLSVKGAAGDTLFKEKFGIPLSMALALLRDPSGNIRLDIPVAVDQSGTKIALGTVVAGALRSAILGAVTSPLKAVGLFTGSSDSQALEPPPIGAEVGRSALTVDGERQVGQLAQFLAGRPGVGIELAPVVTPADVRWLQEQDLRAEFEARTGVMNALRGLPQRGARQRIAKALAERAAGKSGDLGEDDRKQLDEWLAERPAIPPARLRDLARDRAAAVATLLRDRYGIQPDRITVGEPNGEPREGTPSILIAFGAAGE